MTDLVFILGDQLSPGLSSLRRTSKGRARVLMAEVIEEASYVRHHKKKIAFIFSAMRHFAEELRAAGWSVDYVRLDDTGNSGSFTGELARAIARHKPERVLVTEPSEWRVLRDVRAWDRFGLPLEICADDRFLCSRQEFEAWAEGRRQFRMEYFYREMRRKTGLLMDGDQPAGGKWNYDAENRKRAAPDLFLPKPMRFRPDDLTREVLGLVETTFTDNFGELSDFWFAVTRKDAETARDHFLEQALSGFGDFQDAMLASEKFLYHSLLSFYINVGLLDPLDLCRRVEAAFRSGQVALNAAEGFVRQVIGWREYVRGIYWLKMPGYRSSNALGAARPLPDFYWTGDTDMACLRAVITQTQQEAYAHHIQRLMITGNFALLAGVDPHEVHEWYLAVYADAFEWVEMPNTVGMSQFADGGLLGSKPYAASGNYVSRMSDYCDGCAFDVRKKTGPQACPLNALYWDFLSRNAAHLKANPRLAQAYRTWDRMTDEHKADLTAAAAQFLAALG